MIHINIEQQNAILGLEITKPQLHMHTTLPKLNMESQAVIVEIRTTPGQLEIDTTPCRYSLGLKTNGDLARDFASEGKAAALEAVGKMAQDGDRIAAIEKGDALVQLAYEANTPPETDLEWVYKNPPLISYHRGRVEYNVRPPQLNMDFVPGKVTYDLQRGKVSGYMEQMNSLRIWTSGSWEGSFVDYRT